MRTRSILGTLAVTGIVAAACRDSASPHPCLATVQIGQLDVVIESFAPATLFVGETLDLDATVRPVTGAHFVGFGGDCAPSYGEPVPATLEWRSSNTTVATVDSEGRVVGHAQGSATIIARASAHNIEGRHEVAVFVR